MDSATFELHRDSGSGIVLLAAIVLSTITRTAVLPYEALKVAEWKFENEGHVRYCFRQDGHRWKQNRFSQKLSTNFSGVNCCFLLETRLSIWTLIRNEQNATWLPIEEPHYRQSILCHPSTRFDGEKLMEFWILPTTQSGKMSISTSGLLVIGCFKKLAKTSFSSLLEFIGCCSVNVDFSSKHQPTPNFCSITLLIIRKFLETRHLQKNKSKVLTWVQTLLSIVTWLIRLFLTGSKYDFKEK